MKQRRTGRSSRSLAQESNPKPSANSKTTFKRKIAAGIAVFTIATGAGAVANGCEYIPTERIESTVEASETEPSVTVTPTETTVKVTPTETTVAPTETTIFTEDLLLAEAPEIAGLSKEIEDGKVVYVVVKHCCNTMS